MVKRGPVRLAHKRVWRTKLAIDTSDFKNGLSIHLEGKIYQIVEFQHVKPGKGPAFVRTKLRDVRNGNVIEKTFRAGEKMEQAILERKAMQYLYQTGSAYVFMDTEDYDQIEIIAATIGSQVKYLKESMEVSALTHEGEVLGVELPVSVELEIAETDPGLRGDTASGGGKPATLETGAVVTVPLFLNVGDRIKVDTRSDQYLGRVSG
jgi:elongation factor P